VKYYCGAFWMPEWLKKFLSRHFNEACHLHDAAYHKKETTRLAADEKFLKVMIDSSGSTYMAMIYYLAARALGWISWKK